MPEDTKLLPCKEDVQIIKQIVSWCLEDANWREVFKVSRRIVYEVDMQSADYHEQNYKFTDELICLVKKWEKGADDTDYDIYIPLTQLLLSPETVRVCLQKKHGRTMEDFQEHVFECLMWIATAEDRLKYYADNFINQEESKDG